VTVARSAAATVEFRHVTKHYDAAALRKDAPGAVNDLSLTVPAGKICVLVGPSGCGKTTSLKMVNRLIEPTSGQILIDGVDIATREPTVLRREIGYVIQQVGLFPHQTIAENVATVPRLLGWPTARQRTRSDELLALVGLDPARYGPRYPSQLSGGERQRVGVARALAVDPPVMLMDEPFGAVDPIVRERLQNEFLRLQEALAKTILFVTHDIDEAIKMGDRIAVLKQGGVLAQYATPAELLMDPADDFVEDFVGADRALKRLSLMRVSDVNLWEAPIAHVGQATSEVRAKLEGAEVPHPLLVDSERRPLGWLSERDLKQENVPARPDSAPNPILDGADVLRDALADLLQAESQYAPVVDREGRITGVLSVEIISEFLASPEAKVEEHSAVERPHGDA
jgi:osmoprotectant transport system ATP-binding protein